MPKVRASEKQSSDQNPGSLVPESMFSTKILGIFSVPSPALSCIDAGGICPRDIRSGLRAVTGVCQRYRLRREPSWPSRGLRDSGML